MVRESGRNKATPPPPRNPYEFTREEYNQLVRRMGNGQLNPQSVYEEIELVPGCTLYDIYRQPRVPITDSSIKKTLSVRMLDADLKCPVCWETIRQTQVVMECLHRFCGECIQKCLRLNKNECPQCRIHIPSKRSLRRDENFDALIHKIIPNMEAFAEEETKLIAEINKTRYCNNVFTKSAQLGQQQQQIRRQNGKRKITVSTSSPSTSDTESSGPSSGTSTNGVSPQEEQAKKKTKVATKTPTTLSTLTSTLTPSPTTVPTKDTSATEPIEIKVNLRVKRHPEDIKAPELEKTLFRTSCKLKIRHLKKHLISILKTQQNDAEMIRIVLAKQNAWLSGMMAKFATESMDNSRKELMLDQELEDHIMLSEIYDRYQQGMAWELQLYYHFSDAIGS